MAMTTLIALLQASAAQTPTPTRMLAASQHRINAHRAQGFAIELPTCRSQHLGNSVPWRQALVIMVITAAWRRDGTLP